MPWRELNVTEDEKNTAVRAFSKKARFLIDENLDGDVAPFLREKGYNVRTVRQAGLRGHPDENVLALAFRDDRILLTHDRDYLNDRKFPANRNPGVVVLPGANGDTKALVRGLLDLLAVVAPYRGLYRNAKVEIGADRTIRLTMREHDSGKMTTTRFQLSGGHSPLVWADE